MASPNIQITDLDFDSIKQNFITFLQGQDTFKDYNFEGSGLSVLMDILAYNTQYNAYYLNQVANEMFLDSATQRSSVISHAKELNYTPKSAIAPTATVSVVFNNINSNDKALTLPINTHFMSEPVNGVNYTFVTTDSVTAFTNSQTNTVTFTNVPIKQGTIVNYNYTYDPISNPTSTFTIPDDTVDTTTLIVTVQNSSSDTTTTVYTPATDMLTLNSTSTVYFLQESLKGTYEIYFGDGILGSQLTNGNIVKLQYLTTEGTAAAGANSFVLMDSIYGSSNTYSAYTTQSVVAATTGGNKENIASIKFQAPKSYAAQGRAVTKDDYVAFIQGNKLGYSFDSVSVWGGEENNPPSYGQVFIAIKPTGGYKLTDIQKEQIQNNVIAPISMLTVVPNIVDPDYTYLQLTVNVIYDPKKTTSTVSTLQQAITTAITNYSTSSLNTFNSTFSSSDLILAINNVDPSILANEIVVKVQKKFLPQLGVAKSYTLNYGTSLTRNNFLSGISSTPSFQFVSPIYGTLTDVYIEELTTTTNGVDSISILNPGFGYKYAPTVEIIGDNQPFGITATAEATIDTNGSINSITITNAGSNYTTAYVKFIPNVNDTGPLVTATGVVNLQGRYGTLRSYYNNTTNGKTIIDSNIGTVDYLNGVITLNNLNPLDINDPLGQLTITATPTTSIISSSFNRIVTVDPFDPTAITVNITPKT
jgi:hypothetical protein